MNPVHHQVFRNFDPYTGIAPAGYVVDFLGGLSRREFWHAAPDLPQRTVKTTLPVVDEDYFLWVHLLESILCAKHEYTMVELGAGYGEWVVRAFRALARHHQNRIRFRAVAVEADPVHFEWMRVNFADNGVPLSDCTLVPAAVTDKAGELYFLVGSPDGEAPNQWYGQAVSWSNDVASDAGEYGGSKAVRHADGWKSIRVPAISLADVTKDVDWIDFMHLDIQGQELKVLSSALDELRRTTRRLHIDTHSVEIDRGLYELLSGDGWECVRRYGWKTSSDTPHGPIQFHDGVQGWINPGLADYAVL